MTCESLESVLEQVSQLHVWNTAVYDQMSTSGGMGCFSSTITMINGNSCILQYLQRASRMWLTFVKLYTMAT